MLMVAPSNNPDPVGTIARDLGDFTHTFAPRKAPDDLQVAPFHRITCFAVSLLQLIGGEMGNDVNIFRHGIPVFPNSSSRGNSFRLRAKSELSNVFDQSLLGDGMIGNLCRLPAHEARMPEMGCKEIMVAVSCMRVGRVM